MATLPLCVLIVESDQPTRALYQRMLGKDYRVLACSSAPAALLLLRDEHVDAVVWEPNAPEHDDWESAAAMAGALRERGIPLIVCSTLDQRTGGQALDAAAYLIKPVSPATMLEVLRKLTLVA